MALATLRLLNIRILFVSKQGTKAATFWIKQLQIQE
jgi:hypothetical protein